MFFLFLVVAFLQAVTLSGGITCNSLGRACVSSTEYQTCVSVDGEFLATTGLVVKCPEGQICSADSTYPCIDGTSDGTGESPSSSLCGPLGRACISNTEYITCISVDGAYIATTGQIITCPSGQVCKEDTTYPCVDDSSPTVSSGVSCGPMGRACISKTDYTTCISVNGTYVAMTDQIITCPAGQVCNDDSTYPCVDDPSATVSSGVSCGPMGRACISQTDYTTCISVNGTYVAMTDQIITCPAGQVCNEDSTYPCIDATAVPLVAPVPLAIATCSAEGIACISPTEYVTCIYVDGQPTVSSGLTITCNAGTVCNATSPFGCVDGVNPPSASSSSTTSTTLAPVAPTAPTCVADNTLFPGPQCNQYYRCFAVLWWYSLEVLTCPTGQAFDEVSSQCVASTTCVV